MNIGASVGPFVEEITEVPEKFDFVEISLGEMEKDPDELDIDQLQEDLESKGFDLIVHNPFRQPLVTGVEELDSANVEYHERILSVAKELGAEKAVFHINSRQGRDQDKRHLEKLKSIMQEITKRAERRDIEPVFEFVAEDPTKGMLDLSEFGEMLEELDLSACLDTAHVYAEEGQDALNEFLERHLDRISHLHVNDSMNGEPSHVAVGHGEIDWEEFGDRLAGFEGTATMEIWSSDMEYHEISRKKFLEAVGN